MARKVAEVADALAWGQIRGLTSVAIANEIGVPDRTVRRWLRSDEVSQAMALIVERTEPFRRRLRLRYMEEAHEAAIGVLKGEITPKGPDAAAVMLKAMDYFLGEDSGASGETDSSSEFPRGPIFVQYIREGVEPPLPPNTTRQVVSIKEPTVIRD